MNSWLRLYTEFASDPKVQTMSEVMQRRLIMLFCLRSGNVLGTLQAEEIAHALRITEDELAETKALFVRKKFIDEKWSIVNWNKRQFVSDCSTPRTNAHRERLRTLQERSGNGVGTAPDTDTDTDTEQKKNKKKVKVGVKVKVSRPLARTRK
jgi:hypothetical protein